MKDDLPEAVIPETMVIKKIRLLDSLIESSHLINGCKWIFFKRLISALFYLLALPFLLAVSFLHLMPAKMLNTTVDNSTMFRLTIYTIVQIPLVILGIQ